MMFKNYQRMKEYQLIFIVLTATVRNLFKRSAMFQRTIESVNHKVPLTITTEKDMIWDEVQGDQGEVTVTWTVVEKDPVET